MAEMHPAQSSGAGWIVRMAAGSPADRAMEPFVVQTHDQLGQVLSGMLAAIALMAGDEHIQVSIDPCGERR